MTCKCGGLLHLDARSLSDTYGLRARLYCPVDGRNVWVEVGDTTPERPIVVAVDLRSEIGGQP